MFVIIDTESVIIIEYFAYLSYYLTFLELSFKTDFFYIFWWYSVFNRFESCFDS